MKVNKPLRKTWEIGWPLLLGIIMTIILTDYIIEKQGIGWSIVESIITLIIVLFLYYLYERCWAVNPICNEMSDYKLISNIKNLRDLVYEFPENNEDPAIFQRTLNEICNSVCKTIVGDESINDCTDYCVVIYFVIGDDKVLLPIQHDDSKMGNEYVELIMNNKDKTKILLEQNTSYKKVYEEYIKKHRVFIANVSNVRSKAKDGSYQTSIKNFKGVGYKNIPYNSSCISPILPFHNKRNGDEMQGFISIMSTKANAFKDKGIGNIEFERYLEFVSGLVYKVCVRNKSLNN